MEQFNRRSFKFAFIIIFAICIVFFAQLASLANSSISLPAYHDVNDILRLRFKDSHVNGADVLVGAMASGTNNIGSLWDVGKENQPSRVFSNSSAYVTISTTNWVRITSHDWWVGFGRGKLEDYRGNGDAAQLWIDLNSGVNTKQAYAPSAHSTRIVSEWFGVGRYVSFKAGNIHGTAEISFRSLTADEYLERSLVGNVQGEDFEGMMRIVSANSSSGSIKGKGWSLDASAVFTIGGGWDAMFSVEGIIGGIRWRGLFVDDGWIISPRVFTDRDGFLHDCGGISGMSWREDAIFRISPHWRVDLIRSCRCHPNLMIGAVGRSANSALPYVGAAWPQKKRWMPYFRCYPTQNRMELGTVSRGWYIRISGDDWIFSSPRHAEIAVSASALSF
ncbi:MAG: hypothetical protein QME62_08705 [Armatimonadota bacterium]|nr:hypothetical protein [Armatimonadota bacterium]